jgi:hypothetical protein
MVKRGGEPITVNAAVATGLLTAIEEMYRNQNTGGKSKKGGGATGMLGSEIGASHLLLDPNAAVERPFTSPAIGGSNKNNNNTKKSKKNVGGGHNVGELHPAEVTAPLTIVMNADGSMPQVGGKKKSNSKKIRGGSEPAPVDAPQTILMPEKQQTGGKKVKKTRGGDSIRNEEVYNAAINAIPVPNPPVQQGGKKKRVSRKKGGLGEVDVNGQPIPDQIVSAEPEQMQMQEPVYAPEQMQVQQPVYAPEQMQVQQPVYTPEQMQMQPPVGGKKTKKSNNNKKNKKLIGGLAELSAVLNSLSKM